MSETTVLQDHFFIGGQWVAPTTAAVLEVRDPYSLTAVGTAPAASSADVDRAVRAARQAFDSGPWPRMDPSERADWIDRLADELERRGTETAALITREIGQPTLLATGMGAIRPVQHLRFYAALARETTAEVERPNKDRTGASLVRREPVGVAGLIVPWNHPQASVTMKLAPALAAGCTVVIKPSSESPLDAAVIADAAIAIGLPAGVINIVPGDRDAGRALVDHPGVDKVAFTGSTAAGREIAQACARRLIPVTLELGGKSAAIVLPGTPLTDMFASLRIASFGNTGQNCAALSRILVPSAEYAAVRDGLVDLARDLRVGDPTDPSTEIGPLVSATAQARVTAMVDRARADGAETLAGDTPLPDTGYFVAPTIIAGADPDSDIAQNEIFGPVISVHPYSSVDDAVAIANATPYGLAGAVFGPDDEALTVARRMRTGSVGVNGYRPDINLPFGGVKDSGLGRELGPEGLESYRTITSILI